MAADVKGIIYGINGPVIYIKGKTAFRMGEMVYVGPQKLVGEVIRLDSSRTTIQVYEETTGLKPVNRFGLKNIGQYSPASFPSSRPTPKAVY